MQQLVKIIITEEDYDRVKPTLSYCDLREVIVKGENFDGDETHKQLKSASIKAYKALKDYEFNKRHNMKP